MNDDTNDIESRLRRHLGQRAAGVDVHAEMGRSLVVKEDARRHSAVRHRRRMATASALTVAAVTAGLVVISRDPGTEDVATKRNPPAAAPSLAAGSATGSTTGSASGSPTGWSTNFTDGGDVAVGRYAAHLDGYTLSSVSTSTTTQGTGDRAADLAVAAHLASGSPVQFVIASVQDATRLSSGSGGSEVTIAGRHARVISHRAATMLTFDVSATRRALVVTAGVDDATLEAWLGGLSQNADGTWGFTAPATEAGGLAVVPGIATPTAQQSRSLYWEKASASEPCAFQTYGVTVTSGGSYEFWATVSDQVRWATALPTVTGIEVPAAPKSGASMPPASFSGLTDGYGSSILTDGTSVLRVDSSQDSADGSSVPAPALDVLYAPDDSTWATLTPSAGTDDLASRKECIDLKKGYQPVSGSDPVPATTVPGEPAATVPPTTFVTTPSTTIDVPPSTTGA